MNAELAIRRADVLVKAGRPEQALPHATAAVRGDSENAEAWTTLATVYNALEESKKALAAAERAVVLAPDSADAFIQRSEALLDLRRSDQAVAAAREAVRLMPLSWVTHHVLARALFTRHERLPALRLLEEARRHAAEAARLAPPDSRTLRLLAVVHSELGDRQGARDLFERAVRVDPNDAGLWVAYGYAEGNAGRTGPAVRHLGEALRLDPRDTTAPLLLRVLVYSTLNPPMRILLAVTAVLGVGAILALRRFDVAWQVRAYVSAAAIAAAWAGPFVQAIRAPAPVRRFGLRALRENPVFRWLAVSTGVLALAGALPWDKVGVACYTAAMILTYSTFMTTRRLPEPGEEPPF